MRMSCRLAPFLLRALEGFPLENGANASDSHRRSSAERGRVGAGCAGKGNCAAWRCRPTGGRALTGRGARPPVETAIDRWSTLGALLRCHLCYERSGAPNSGDQMPEVPLSAPGPFITDYRAVQVRKLLQRNCPVRAAITCVAE